MAQSCYCTGGYTYNQTYGGNTCIANADCWACQPGAYNTAWQQGFCPNYQATTCTPETQTRAGVCPTGYNGIVTETNTKTCPSGTWTGWVTTTSNCTPNCTPVTETRQQSCPVNYTGFITETRTKTCPDNQWQAWQTSQNNCVKNPPTCKTTTETQTLQCQTGYTGSIIQTRSSMCPDPYGQPVMGAWTTTTDTCVKSVSNPTNPTSPVAQSIISPTAMAPSTPLPQTPPLPPTMSATPTEPTVEAPKQEPKQETSSTSSQPTSQPSASSTTSTSQPTTSQAPKPKLSIGGLNLASSLDLVSKPMIQYNSFPVQTLTQELPLEVRLYNNMMMDMIGIKPISQDEQFFLLNRDAMEFEQ